MLAIVHDIQMPGDPNNIVQFNIYYLDEMVQD